MPLYWIRINMHTVWSIINNNKCMYMYMMTCHSKFRLNGVTIFNQENYNFENYIVSHALASQNWVLDGDKEYICKTRHKNLEENDNHIPCMPKNAVACKKLYLAVSFCKQYVKNLNLFVHAVTDGCFKNLWWNLMFLNMIWQIILLKKH